jgi:hypothetical protein
MTRSVITADEFLTAPALDRAKMDVPVPELGEDKVIPVWGMTPRERTDFEDAQSRLTKAQQAKHKREIRERILVECCRADDGSKLFTSQQIEQLSQRRGDVVERLVNVALELSGFTGQDIEKIAKNSEAATEE